MPKRTDNFQKFVKQKKGSAIKEEIKQGKRREKKERAAAIERHFEERRAERMLQRTSAESAKTTKPGRVNKYPRKEVNPETKTPNIEASKAPAKTPRENKYPKKVEKAEPKGPVSKATKPSPNGPGSNKYTPKVDEAQQRGSFSKSTESAANTPRPNKFTPKVAEAKPKGAFNKSTEPVANTPGTNKYTPKVATSETKPSIKKAPESSAKASQTNKYTPKGSTTASKAPVIERASGDVMPLNKYIAHSGICSRRDAADLVKEGKVSVNGTIASDPGMKVSSADVVSVSNKKITPSRNFVYILLNKPKDFITTSEDPQGRKTVMDLVKTATNERVYPVGRLDRNTSGVLLLTNDGDLAQKLSHPRHEIKKVYEVRLDRPLTKSDMDAIATGITLEDGFVAPDVIAYADSKDKSVIGIEIHSGRNRIVRRIFEHMKYDVKALDRVMFAGLTKKDVQRGKWRFLKDKELRILKFMNQSFLKVKQ